MRKRQYRTIFCQIHKRHRGNDRIQTRGILAIHLEISCPYNHGLYSPFQYSVHVHQKAYVFRVGRITGIDKFSHLLLPNFLTQLVLNIFFYSFQGIAVPTAYPSWVLAIAAVIIFAGIAPIPIVFLLRRFQCVKLDVDIHQGSIRRIDTTVSTKEMMGDVDVSRTKKASIVIRSFHQYRSCVLIILSIWSYTSRHMHLHLLFLFIIS